MRRSTFHVRHGALAAITGTAALAVTGTALGLVVSGTYPRTASTTIVREIPAAETKPAAKPPPEKTTPAPSPSATATAPAKTVYLQAPPPTTRTVYVQAPAVDYCAREIDGGAADPSCPAYRSPGGLGYTPPPQYAPDPYSVVSQYYADIEAGDFSAAWNLQSFMSSGYDTWVAGYANTGAQTLTENSESGDSVSVSLTAYDTAASVYQGFQCTYTVDSGIITSGSCTQTY